MSMVITDGFLMKSRSIDELNTNLEKISAYLTQYINEGFLKEICKLGCMILDYKKIGKNEEFIRRQIDMKYNFEIEKNISFVCLLKELCIKDIRPFEIINTYFDFDVKILVYTSNIIEDKVLIRINSNNNYLNNIISGIPKKFNFIEDYVYYNHTDKPDNISDDEWDKREGNYKALSNSIILNFILEPHRVSSSKFSYQRIEELTKELYSERILSIAEYLVKTEYYENIESGNIKGTISNIAEFKKSDEYKKELEVRIKYLNDVVPKEYDFLKDFIKIRI